MRTGKFFKSIFYILVLCKVTDDTQAHSKSLSVWFSMWLYIVSCGFRRRPLPRSSVFAATIINLTTWIKLMVDHDFPHYPLLTLGP